MASTRTSVFSVKECVIYPLIEDNEGAKPVYGPGIKVPCIQTISETKTYTSESLPGDDTVCDTQSSFESLEGSAEYGQLDHVLKTVLEGGIHRLLPTSSQYIFGGDDIGSQFALKYRGTKVGAGSGKDYVKTYWKVTAGTTNSDNAQATFKTNSFDWAAARLDGKVLHPKGNDFELEEIRDASAAGAIDLNTPFPTLPTVETLPTLSSSSPAEGGTVNAATPATITATFSVELADDTVNARNFAVWDKTANTIVVPDVVEKNNGTPAQVDIDVDIVSGHAYALIISKNVASTTHNVAMGAQEVINFTGVTS